MATVTGTRKFGATAALFVAAVGCVALASATDRVWPLFVAWVPLLSVVWVLTRPEPGTVTPAGETPTEDA
jgi:hypothetical protein